MGNKLIRFALYKNNPVKGDLNFASIRERKKIALKSYFRVPLKVLGNFFFQDRFILQTSTKDISL